MQILKDILGFIRALFLSRRDLAVENMVLRQQLIVLRRSVKRPKFRRADRIFWVWLSMLWGGWRSTLYVAQPATVVRWHGGFCHRVSQQLQFRHDPWLVMIRR